MMLKWCKTLIVMIVFCCYSTIAQDDLDYSLKLKNTHKGIGYLPQNGARVKVHYTGKFTSGEVFDSSETRNKPFEFIIGKGQVIECWDIAFKSLKKGQTAEIVCPSDIAYGEKGGGSIIPPGSTLIFDVELIDVNQDGKIFKKQDKEEQNAQQLEREKEEKKK